MRLALLLFAACMALSAPEYEGIPNRDRLFAALSRVENCRVWNNPGCLKFARQKGARKGPRGFAVFRTISHGKEALRARIQLGSGQKISTFLRKYNPGARGYVAKVLRVSGLKANDVI